MLRLLISWWEALHLLACLLQHQYLLLYYFIDLLFGEQFLLIPEFEGGAFPVGIALSFSSWAGTYRERD